MRQSVATIVRTHGRSCSAPQATRAARLAVRQKLCAQAEPVGSGAGDEGTELCARAVAGVRSRYAGACTALHCTARGWRYLAAAARAAAAVKGERRADAHASRGAAHRFGRGFSNRASAASPVSSSASSAHIPSHPATWGQNLRVSRGQRLSHAAAALAHFTAPVRSDSPPKAPGARPRSRRLPLTRPWRSRGFSRGEPLQR